MGRRDNDVDKRQADCFHPEMFYKGKNFYMKSIFCYMLLPLLSSLHIFVLGLWVAVLIFVDIYISVWKKNCNKIERKLKI